MITTEFNGRPIPAHPEFGRILITEIRGDMAIVRTERGIVYIRSVREPNPNVGAVQMPADCEPA